MVRHRRRSEGVCDWGCAFVVVLMFGLTWMGFIEYQWLGRVVWPGAPSADDRTRGLRRSFVVDQKPIPIPDLSIPMEAPRPSLITAGPEAPWDKGVLRPWQRGEPR